MSSCDQVSRTSHDEMAEHYDRDHRRIHVPRNAVTALSIVLEDEECMAGAQEYIGAKLKLERRAELLEARWD